MKLTRHTALKWLLNALLLLLAWQALNGMLPHQLSGAVLFDMSIDNTFWLFHYSGLARWMHHSPMALPVLEVMVLLVGAALFLTGRWPLNVALLTGWVILSLYQQTYSCTLTKISVVVPVVLFPFCFRGHLFNTALWLPRCYLVYMMAGAALFKILNGGLFHPGQMEHILTAQHADLAAWGSRHISLRISELLLARPLLATGSYWMLFLLELSFVVLLFTRKADRVFIVLLVLFCVSVYTVMRINTIEIMLLIFALLNIRDVD